MQIKLTIFFTYGISLDIWKKKGLLNRELKIYEELIKKHDIQIQLLTYGNNSDYQWVKDFKGLTVLPVYSRINFSKLITSIVNNGIVTIKPIFTIII